jgi:SH3-like domain-containing protein
MTIRNTLKTAAISLVLVVGTASSAFAGVAWVDDTTKVKDAPYKHADTIGWAKEGKKVWVEECFKAYCYIEQKSGADGWVRKSDLSFKKWGKGSDVDVEICLGGGGFGGGGYGFGHICIEN